MRVSEEKNADNRAKRHPMESVTQLLFSSFAYGPNGYTIIIIPAKPITIPTMSHFLIYSPSMLLAMKGPIRVLVKNKQNALAYEVISIAANSSPSARNPPIILLIKLG
jgi:hypothetical protein